MNAPATTPLVLGSARQARLATLRAALGQGALRTAQRVVHALHPAEIAQLLESLPPAQREVVWEFVEPEVEGEVLVELSDHIRGGLIRGMEPEELAAATENLEVDDLADLVADLPENLTRQLLKSMDQSDRERLNRVLAWPEDSAGGLMNTDTVSVRADASVEVVLRYLRMRGELPQRTDSLFIVDRRNRYLGTVPLARLLTAEPEGIVAELLDIDSPRIAPELPASEVARLFQDRDLVSAAVVDGEGQLLGRITVDDVVDVISEEAAHSVMSMAGLHDEEDVFAGVMTSTRRRLLWLGINLVTAFMAAAVVRPFEGTIEKVAALAALMPIVASMGGIAGTQTVTLIIRGLALGQVQWANARWLLFKEIAVGGVNGLIWAIVVAAVTISWFGTWKIAAIIGAAMVVNLLVAAIVGVVVPLALRRLRIDPALSAGVILTTFTDCIGFATLLGLGTLFLT
ncbi:MAG: magnesium transporter [Steroidobacteraceae bacterium]